MFSDHLQKLTRFPRLGLMVLAAGLVVVCQLLAMLMVGDNPLQNTSVRDLQQVALADCVRHSTWATRHGCIGQSQLESDDRELLAASPVSEGSASRKDVVTANEGATSDSANRLRVAAAP